MTLTHVIMTRADGVRLELTIDEAQQIWAHLGLFFRPQVPFYVAPQPQYPSEPVPWPQPHWVGPTSADPLPVPPFIVTCEATQ